MFTDLDSNDIYVFNEILDTIVYCSETCQYPWEEFNDIQIDKFVSFVRSSLVEVNNNDG